MTSYGKVEIGLDRQEWRPTPLIEQVVLITTANGENQPHVATKSRVSVVSYGPPAIVFFACTAHYTTAKNIQETKQFVINVPSNDLVAMCWLVGSDPRGKGAAEFDNVGLTRIPGLKVNVPRIAECQAHFECELVETVAFGQDLAVFGKVLSLTVDHRLLEGETVARYELLAPVFFLEADWTGTLGSLRQIDQPVPGPQHKMTVIAVRDLERSALFYKTAFNWLVRVEEPTYLEFELPAGQRLALCRSDAFAKYAGKLPQDLREGEISGIELRLYCDDLPHLVARLMAAGARLLRKIDPTDNVAFFADLDGHVLALYHRAAS